MIVVSMTTEEIYKEIMRDFESINRRGYFEGKILYKEMRRKGLSNETRSVCYKTPHRNEWTIIFEMDAMGTKTAYYLKSNDARGMVAYMIQFIHTGTPQADKFVIKYSRHFFERYNERMCLGLTDNAKAIKHFFKNNFEYHQGQSNELVDDLRYMHFVFKSGIAIGWQNDVKKTIHMKTFVSNDMLTANQRSLAEHIKYGGDEDEFSQTVKIEHLLKAF